MFQPWANEVVNGKLNYLVRSFSTHNRGIVAVIATKKIDNVWLKSASEKEVNKIQNNIGVIGTVNIKNCYKIKSNKVKDELVKLAGEKYWDYYPEYLIPTSTRIGRTSGKLSIWVLDNAKEWKQPKEVESKSGAITWMNINLDD